MRWFYLTAILLCLANLTAREQPKIIIVGAGASGVAAASKLYENGFQDVTILEAENRIGGRVNTTWFGNSWVDLGAQWVGGQTNNIAYELAEPLGLLEVPGVDYTQMLVYDSEGNKIPTSISDELLGMFFNLLERGQEDLKGSNGSIGEYFTRMIIREAIKFPGVDQALAQQFTKVFEGYANAQDASESWFNTSARGYIESWACPGSATVNWKGRGYGTILDIITKKYPNPENELPVRDNTKFNTEVVKIDYNSTEGKVLVESSNGEKHTADHVIVTPSLGVLKEQYQTLFTPELPESKVKTIKGLTMGATAKTFFLFEAPWWPKDFNSLFMWTESDRQEYESDPDKKWLLDFIGVFAVPHRPRVLLGWMSSPGGRHMEALPEDQAMNQTFSIIHKFLGKSYNITTPTGFLRSNWSVNKHFQGTYSFRSMETEEADVWADDLAAPLLVNDKPTVMFAGEATHTHYYATVHGAIETGFREANRLIELYNTTSTQ